MKGFGRWTAEMFLMFRLHRPDVLPAGDLGIVNAIQRLYQLAQAAGREAHAENRRGVAAVPIGGVLVSVADAQKRAFSPKQQYPDGDRHKVPRSLKSVSRPRIRLNRGAR